MPCFRQIVARSPAAAAWPGAHVLREQAAVGRVQRRGVDGFARLQRAQAALRAFASLNDSAGVTPSARMAASVRRSSAQAARLSRRSVYSSAAPARRQRDRGGHQHDQHQLAGETAARVANGQKRAPRTAVRL